MNLFLNYNTNQIKRKISTIERNCGNNKIEKENAYV
nr:MAG TPA: hypothetical protein [Caudoviricetes sp.]